MFMQWQLFFNVFIMADANELALKSNLWLMQIFYWFRVPCHLATVFEVQFQHLSMAMLKTCVDIHM